MKNFSKYGTILTREESKTIRGGGCIDWDSGYVGDPEVGGCRATCDNGGTHSVQDCTGATFRNVCGDSGGSCSCA